MNEEQLVELLSVYRFRRPMPALPRRSRAVWWLSAAAAALIGIAALGIWSSNAAGWRVGWRALRAGETIANPARIRSRAVGYVDVAANTVVRYEGGDRLSLERGTIHAKTISPPGVFIVDTPRARAIDLGCEYTLSVAPSGGGVLRVSAGWVQLQRDGRQTLVPEGARASIRSDGTIGPPLFDDASPAFRSALLRGDLNAALPLARTRDAFTLLNLLRDASTDERLRIYDRLNALVPAPASIPRDAMRNWYIGTADAWWADVLKASGVHPLKKKRRR